MAARGEDVLTRFAPLALVAAVLAGCGSSGSTGLDRASEATAAQSSRVEMVYDLGGTNTRKGYTFRASGRFDYPGDRAVMTTSDSLPLFGENVRLTELRLIGRTAYFGWELDGKALWTKQDPALRSGDPVELLVPSPGTPTKPTDVLERVLEASEESTSLGSEEVRGERTTHYRARVSLKKLLEQLPAAERRNGGASRFWGGPVVPVDIWIDGDSRLRRISIRRPGNAQDAETEFTATIDLYDYGVEVDVQPPPEDELISQAEFDKLAGPLVTADGEGGEAEIYTCGPDCPQAPGSTGDR